MVNMKKYEYRYIEFEGTCIDSENTLEGLNRLGQEGWQITSSIRNTSSNDKFGAMFIRELAEIRANTGPK